MADSDNATKAPESDAQEQQQQQQQQQAVPQPPAHDDVKTADDDAAQAEPVVGEHCVSDRPTRTSRTLPLILTRRR